jgi:hypothetical protein
MVSSFSWHPQRTLLCRRDSASPSLHGLRLVNDNSSDSKKARVRFSGASDSKTASVSNPIDFALSWIVSDLGSIVVGLSGIVMLLVGRLILDADVTVTDAEAMTGSTRSNLLAVFACVAVLLNGLVKLDVESTTAESVELQGSRWPVTNLQQDPNSELVWALDSLLKATSAETAILLEQNRRQWNIDSFAGIVPWSLTSNPISLATISTPILDRCLKQARESQSFQETYLPTLQALPGKTEFIYMPVNTQAILLLPFLVGERPMILVLGSNRARSFTPRDIAWCQLLTSRLAETIGSTR